MLYRWYVYNETLNEYCDTHQQSFRDVQRMVDIIVERQGWSSKHRMHYVRFGS